MLNVSIHCLPSTQLVQICLLLSRKKGTEMIDPTYPDKRGSTLCHKAKLNAFSGKNQAKGVYNNMHTKEGCG